jgi:hypothetical protein
MLKVPRRPALFSPSCVVLSIFRVGGRADPGEDERETEDAGTQQTRAHAQRTHSSFAPLSVSSAASEAVEAAEEETRAQSYSQWHPLNLWHGCGGRGGGGNRLRWGEGKGARARLLRLGVSLCVRLPMRVGAATLTNFFLLARRKGPIRRRSRETTERRRGCERSSGGEDNSLRMGEGGSFFLGFRGCGLARRGSTSSRRRRSCGCVSVVSHSFGWSVSSA